MHTQKYMSKKKQLRLAVRPMTEDDRKFVTGLYMDELVMTFVGGVLSEVKANAVFSEMLKVNKSNNDTYQIVTNCGVDVGFLSMQVHQEQIAYLEVGIILGNDYQGLGIARWIQHQAFEYGRHKFNINVFSVYCDPDHEGVNRCYHRMGFKLVANTSKKKQHINKNHWRLKLEQKKQ